MGNAESEVPMATMNEKGVLRLNKAARERFRTPDFAYCRISYVLEDNCLLIELTNDEDGRGERVLKLGDRGAVVHLNICLYSFGIDHSVKKRFELSDGEEFSDNCIAVQLDCFETFL